jgi:hypothetical protein
MPTSYTIHVRLLYLEPEIWREVVLDPDLPLADVHQILQTTMGWTNSHLHQFSQGLTFYSPPDEDDDDEPFGTYEVVDYTKKPTRLSDLLKKKGDTLEYEYDFGDGWKHEIELRDIHETEKKVEYPVCIGGERKCPVEDSGGPPGFAMMLEALNNPKHPQYDEYKEWFPEDFDPSHFNRKFVNKELKSKNYGVMESWI